MLYWVCVFFLLLVAFSGSRPFLPKPLLNLSSSVYCGCVGVVEDAGPGGTLCYRGGVWLGEAGVVALGCCSFRLLASLAAAFG